jgi:hypothetical protein
MSEAAMEADMSATGLDRSPRSHQVAAGLTWIAALACTALISVDLWLANQTGLTQLTATSDLTIVGTAVVGAVLVSRRPRNPVGWILCGIGFTASLGQFAWNYGYYAVTLGAGSAPFGLPTFWLGTWIWLVPLGVGLPTLTVRLPNGHAAGALRLVDWLAVGGTAALIVATALMPGPLDPRSTVLNPFGIPGAGRWFIALRWAGYLAVGAAVVAAVAWLVNRLRGSHGEVREQIKWIASSGALMTIALIYGFLRQVFGNENLYDAMVPFLIATATLPLSIGVAVLKYRLYQIDLIINRALVYGCLTAGLAGLFAVSLGIAQQFVAYTGQRSEAAILMTAFIGTTAFTPVKQVLQRAVDSKFSVIDPVANVNSLRAQVEVVVHILDGQRIARRLVDDLAADYRARFVSLSLKSNGQMIPFHSTGEAADRPVVAIPLHSQGQEVGVLSLGERHGGLSYTPRDRQALQLCADAVADAMAWWRSGQSTAH